MEHSHDISALLEQILCPAFVVRDGMIAEMNQEAVGLQIEPGTRISTLICCGQEDYNAFSQGCLCLSIGIGELSFPASVERTESYDIFYLESEFSSIQLRTFALVSQVLREPLSGAMSSAELLGAESPSNSNLLQMKKNLHQLHRALCNMSDASIYEGRRMAKLESCNICSFADELMQKAGDLLKQAGINLAYSNRCQGLICLADRDKLERAMLNMISNAAKFRRPDTPITVELEKRNDRLVFSVTNTADLTVDLLRSDFFTRFRRAPALESYHSGIGLGLSIVRSVAAYHSGTVLLDKPEPDKLRFTMSMPIQRSKDSTLRAPVQYPIDYAGGFDHVLMELSGVLPPKVFE